MRKKKCTGCGVFKPLSEYHKNKNHKDGHQYRCKQCNSAKHGGYSKQAQLKHRYGISLIEYSALLEFQGGGCAICGVADSQDGRSLHVDHDHETGTVRGILCAHCNKALGLLRDSTEFCLKAAEYLGGESDERAKHTPRGQDH